MKEIHYIYNDTLYPGTVSNDLKFILPSIKSGIDAPLKIEDVRLLTPLEPSKIVCVGRNYAEHAAELGNELPKDPMLFLKAPSSIVLDGEYIELPPQSEQVEHEGELGIVIGKTCKNVKKDENSTDYILGFICLNDITARDLQRKDIQFTRAKSFDTFCPVSKYITTYADVEDTQIETKVNGAVKQAGRTSQMIFSIEYLIKYISNQMTLNFGDIIATGTPSGVSVLKDGDICEVSIEGVGKISNPVRNSVNK